MRGKEDATTFILLCFNVLSTSTRKSTWRLPISISIYIYISISLYIYIYIYRYIYIQIHDFLLFSHRSQKQKFGDAQMNKERPSNKAPLE